MTQTFSGVIFRLLRGHVIPRSLLPDGRFRYVRWQCAQRHGASIMLFNKFIYGYTNYIFTPALI